MAPAPTFTAKASAAANRAERRDRARGEKKKGGVLNLAVMTLAAGLVATMALPAYAFNPTALNGEGGDAELAEVMANGEQNVTVSENAAANTATRDAFTATTTEELAAAKAAAAATAAAEAQRAANAAATSSYAGPSASDYLASGAATPSFSLGGVFATAQQYIGTPYVFGGADPSGFDCSGLVMFVYAQYGISLPHGVRGQFNAGTVIPESEARPGDLIIFKDFSHNGFYGGNGMILDAPRRGKNVSLRPLWTDAVYYVRLGI
jgi:cell wall-associated NlpC family hydrolase